MSKSRKNAKSKNRLPKKEKYNADNEIIIGVTTINKENRVEKEKSTRKNNNKKRTGHNKIKKTNKIENISKEKIIRKNNKKRVVIGCIISFVILVSCIVFLMTTPKCYITEIKVDGYNKNSEETYISLTKIELNTTNIFTISKNNIIKNIEENPYVDSVQIRRELPGTLHITVKERTVAYQVENSGKYAYIDKQGYILEIGEELKTTTKLIGLECTNKDITEGQRLDNDDLIKLELILKIINQCKYNNIENEITDVDISNKANIKLNIENGNKVVYLGDASNINERILWLKTILEKEKKNKGEIFINGDLNSSRIYFKPIVEK